MSENEDSKNAIKISSSTVPTKVGQGPASLAKRGLGLLKNRTDQPPQSPVVHENEHKVGDTMTVTLPGGFEMAFCYIPAGEFLMGSPEDEWERYDVEGPVHRVEFSQSFWMGRFQVIQALWRLVAESLPKVEIELDPYPSGFAGKDLPFDQVSWEECQEFLARLNSKGVGKRYRLPTEAEWEYACRAGTTTPFFCGASITPEQVNFNVNGPYGNAAKGLYREKTVPVGSLNFPNAWGLHDMHGNVWEGCADWYDADFYKKSPLTDPKGPESGEYRVQRGGSWHCVAFGCRSANRSKSKPSDQYYSGFGFRVVAHSQGTKSGIAFKQ